MKKEDDTQTIKDLLLLEDKNFLFVFSNEFPSYTRSNFSSAEIVAKTKEEATIKFNKMFPNAMNVTIQETGLGKLN